MMQEAAEEIVARDIPFKLRPPHTVESVRLDAERSASPKSWRCRRGWHSWRKIGEVHVPDAEAMFSLPFQELELAVSALIASSRTSLSRCKRCGNIGKQLRL